MATLSRARAVVLCLRANGAIVGAAAGWTFVEDSAAVASVEQVCVAPPWRRRSVASFLVDELGALFQNAGVARVYARVEMVDQARGVLDGAGVDADRANSGESSHTRAARWLA